MAFINVKRYGSRNLERHKDRKREVEIRIRNREVEIRKRYKEIEKRIRR